RSGSVVWWTPGREGAGSEERTGGETAPRLRGASAGPCHDPEAAVHRDARLENDEQCVLEHGPTRVGSKKIVPFLRELRLEGRPGTAPWRRSFLLPVT